MSKVDRFEELIAWQKARVLAQEVYKVSRQPLFQRDFAICNQIRRAVISIMSNIAEGFERNRSAEFHQFLSVAKASCAEVRPQLYIAFDVGYLTQDQFTRLLQQAEEVTRILAGLRTAVARNLPQKTTKH